MYRHRLRPANPDTLILETEVSVNTFLTLWVSPRDRFLYLEPTLKLKLRNIHLNLIFAESSTLPSLVASHLLSLNHPPLPQASPRETLPMAPASLKGPVSNTSRPLAARIGSVVDGELYDYLAKEPLVGSCWPQVR